MPKARLPHRIVVLVNADFESRHDEALSDGPRAFEADAAVLETAAAVRETLQSLGVEVVEQRVTNSLSGVVDSLRRRQADLVFNLVESIDNDYGREWQVPALLSRAGLAHTGNPALPLRLCRQKDKARRVLHAAGVRVAPGLTVVGSSSLVPSVLKKVTFPAFVKPARVDGSIGVDRFSIVQDGDALRARVALLEQSLKGPFLVEAYLPGKELNVSIFPGPVAGQVVTTELDFSAVEGDLPPIVTYDCKWNEASPEYAARSVAADLDPALRLEVEGLARKAFLALGGTAYGRVDMRLDAQGRPCVMDVNPNNDLHPDAGLAVSARTCGWDYAGLLASVVAHAQNVSKGAL